jgi:lipopolysaccharide export system protein LptC
MEDAAVIGVAGTMARLLRRTALSAALCLALAGCTSLESQQQEAPPPTFTLYGMKLTSFRGEDVVAAGRAAKLSYVRTTTDFNASEVLIRFPSRTSMGMQSGLVSGGMEVRAPTVLGNQSARQADGEGGVVMRSGDGVVAKTQRAHFDGVARVATGDTQVDADGPRYALTADRFKLSFATELFEFEGNVQTRLGAEKLQTPEPRP